MTEVKKLTLGLAMIVKDETTVLKNCLESVNGIFDKVTIGYTSKNNPDTERILRKFNCKVVPIEWKRDFSYARNISFKECDTDLIMWLDADDTLTLLNGCNKSQFKANVIKEFTLNPSLGCMWADYKYDFDKYGNCISTLIRERIVRKGWYEWRGTLHENCIPLFKTLNAKQDFFEIKHNSSPIRMAESSKRNFEIALANYQEEMKADKLTFLTVYDLARSVSILKVCKSGDVAMKGIEASMPYFYEALKLAKDDANRAEILMKLAEMHRRINLFEDAMNLDSQVIKLKPSWPDGYIGLGLSNFYLDRYEHALACFVNSLNLDVSNEILAQDPTKYKSKVYEKIAFCLFYMEQPEKSLQYVKLVLESNPDDTEMHSLKKVIEEVMKKESMTKQILELKKEIEKEKKNDKLKNLALCVPEWMEKEAFVVRLKNEFCPANDKNKVIIFCGDSKHPWSPNSVKKGIGGSEEAVIYMSKELAELGWNVDVYCNCDTEGNFAGVMWKHYLSYTDNEKADIFIAWRDQSYVRIAPKESKKYVWLHDVCTDDNWDITLNDQIEKVFFLSKYHRSLMPRLPEDKVFLTANGIIKEHFTAFDELEKVKNRCVYVSNPDRGLFELLTMWPDIQKAIPTATLHVFYGFEVWDMMYSNDEKMRQRKAWMLEEMKKLACMGVKYYGKIGHLELANQLALAEYWLYPDFEFPEIFCISAIKAQASGCYPITSDFGALDETVKYGHKVLKESKNSYLVDTIETMKNGIDENYIDEMKKWARDNYQWSTIAKQWSDLWKK